MARPNMAKSSLKNHVEVAAKPAGTRRTNSVAGKPNFGRGR
jgi:hypothetical protein